MTDKNDEENTWNPVVNDVTIDVEAWVAMTRAEKVALLIKMKQQMLNQQTPSDEDSATDD